MEIILTISELFTKFVLRILLDKKDPVTYSITWDTNAEHF